MDYYNLDMILAIGYKINSKRGIQFRKWANSVLKEYMLKGYVINENRTLVTNENYVNLISKVESIDNRVLSLENKINKKELPLEKIFYNGEVYDAYEFIQNIFKQANKEIIIIDSNELYHLGSSIKDAGKKIFGINKIDSEFIDMIIKK